jgi:hypothetical protein
MAAGDIVKPLGRRNHQQLHRFERRLSRYSGSSDKVLLMRSSRSMSTAS